MDRRATLADQHLRPVPPASSNASDSRRSRSGRWARRRRCPPRPTAHGRQRCAHGGADDGDRTLGTGLEGAGHGQVTEVGAAEHGDQSRRPDEPVHLLVERDVHHLEVERQGNQRPDRRPSRNRAASQALFGDQRHGRGAGASGTAHHPCPSLEQPSGHLHGLGEYPAKPWCSLVITPSKPDGGGQAACRGFAREPVARARGVEPIVRVELAIDGEGGPAHGAGGWRQHRLTLVAMQIGVVFPQTEMRRRPPGDPLPARRGGGDGVRAPPGLRSTCSGPIRRVHERWNGPYDIETTFHEPFVLFRYLGAVRSRARDRVIILL